MPLLLRMEDQSSQIGRVLSAALDASPEVRQKGEALIKSLSLHPGFGHALVQASLRQVKTRTSIKIDAECSLSAQTAFLKHSKM